MKKSCQYNQIPINDIRIKYGNDLFKFPEKTINYKKLLQFIKYSFPKAVLNNFKITFYTENGISINITDNYNLHFTIEHMNNKYGTLQLTSMTLLSQVEIKTDIEYDETEEHTKFKDEELYLENTQNEKNFHEPSYNRVNSYNCISSARKLTDIILDCNEEEKEIIPQIKVDEYEAKHQYSEIRNSEEIKENSPIRNKKIIRNNKKAIFNAGLSYLSDSKIAELKEKYSNNKDKRDKATRFSRVRGKNELCNSDKERDIFEEWLVISKANVKQHIKRYSEDTTLAIFFDKFSVNIRIRIQLYTHKSQKSKKTSQTFTFYKNGINENWTKEEASQKLENFLRFALENLFEIKGPINLDDF